MAKCKRCGLKTVLNKDEIDKMVDDVRNMKIPLADDNLYQKRLAVCGECEKIEYGSTCMACGCMVQVRALTADGKCPMKKWLC